MEQPCGLASAGGTGTAVEPARPAPAGGTGGGDGPHVDARGGPWTWVLLAMLPASVLALFWRTWQQLFAFDRGLDSTLPGFDRYWMSIFLFNVTVIPLVVAGWYAWLWLSGRRMVDQPMDEATELRRIWVLWMLLVGFAMAAWWGGSYFTEQDASWHQVTLRDTAFTPSHIGLFYGAFPLMVYGAGGAFLYARTRLPHLYGGRSLPVPFLLMIAGTVLLLFQVAFNEFGHTFWETEEIFNAPLHWPFVFFAYFLASTFAVLLVTLDRVLEIVRGARPGAGRLGGGLDADGLVALPRRWDAAAIAVIVLVLAAAMHMESTLFAGEWSFWADWKDRQWWPLVTPAANMILVGTAQYALWRRFRLPVGATLAASCLVVAQLVSRTATFDLWANLPVNFTWPETLVLLGILLDVTLLLSRSYVITSLVGGLLWGGLFWFANLPLIAPFHEPVIVNGQVLTVADWMAFQFPRSQGPEYLRMIEEGHLRALVGNVTAIVAFFAAMLSAATWWIGIGIAKVLIFWPMGRTYELRTDTAEPAPTGAEVQA